MNYSALVTEVMATIRRPDKILDVGREINAALIAFSADYDFPRDIEEVTVSIDPIELSQQVKYNLIPRFRKFQYMKRAGTREFLCPLDPKKIFQRDCDLADKYYFIGDGVRISMTRAAPALDIGYWQYPPMLSDAWPDHWFLDNGWPVIYDRACAKIFAGIGDEASAGRHERNALNAFAAFRASHIR